MSRAYRMQVEIHGNNPERKEEIVAAAEHQWGFEPEDWYQLKHKIINEFESMLVGGETEDEFVNRFSQAIWKANQGFCTVTIQAYYLEDLPCEIHELNKDDYQEWITKNG